MKQFLGLCLLMGNLNFPSLKHYWATSPLYEHPVFGRTMPRNRFEKILKCLCFYDPETDPVQHKLHKIDQVLDYLLEKFTDAYSPGKSLSLDEAMILWRGRLSFRQYIKNKRHKYGIKLYELCTPDGYILNILIYSGKGTMNDEERGHTFHVVMRLMDKYLGKGHAVYLDNFYNSVSLAEHLLENKTGVCGTLQAKRTGNPVEVIEAKLNKGETISRQKGDVTIMKWKDKRNVLTISTMHGPTIEDTTNRRGQVVSKPSMVIAYNKNMSGIDRSDQMISYYSTPRKSLRWYIKIFFHLLDASLWNSMFICTKNGNKITYLKFREIIIEDLLQIQPVERPTSSRGSPRVQHVPEKLKRRVRCRNCRQSKDERRQTFFVCSVCKDKDGKPFGLCVPACFKEWHV